MAEQFFEDFQVGQKFRSGTITVTADMIKAFAREFDPQPFHVDEKAAADSFFAGLAASGWHTSAMTMRLVLDGELRPAGGIIGAGMEELRWPIPVRPGDVLTTQSEVLELRPSKSRPEIGLVKLRITTLNQANEAVQIFVPSLIVKRRIG
jgi:acyl dehydratase